MKKKSDKIISRAKKIIENNDNDTSIYYLELVKSYNEFNKNIIKDKITSELYLSQIEKLCNFIEEKRSINVITIIVSIMFVISLSFGLFYTYKYYDIYNNLKENIIKGNKNASLIVNYVNLENFNAINISNEKDYKKLDPLKINLLAKSSDDKSYDFHYNVYLVPENDGLENVLDKSYISYVAETQNRNSGVKRLSNASETKGRLLIYSSKAKTNIEEEVNIRMWIDSSVGKDYLNKKYKFKIYVDGYVI